MKKRLGILFACVLLCSMALSLTACQKANNGENVGDGSGSSRSAKAGSKFTKDDTVVAFIGVGSVSLGMTKDEVETVLGKPKKTQHDDLRGEVWYYPNYDFDVSFREDAAEVMTAGTAGGKTVLLKSRDLSLDATVEDTIAAFYDDGRKKRIDFISEIKKRKLGDTLLKEYAGVDAYYLYGDLFDDGVTECGYVQHMTGDDEAPEYDSIVYTYVDLDEGSAAAGDYYTLSFDTYTDDDGTDRIGYLYLSRTYQGE